MSELFSRFARAVEKAVGSSWSFLLACLLIVVWAVTGPLFGWSDTWQLVINTGTTIITFLVVFLIQHTQSRDTMAMQLKLDELIRSSRDARNTVIGAEQLDEAALKAMQHENQRRRH